MINYKHLESVSLSPVESPLQAAGFSARPSVRRPRHCAGSGPARKYEDGLEAHVGDGVATRMRPGNTFTATEFHGGYPAAVLRDRVRKLGMGFVRPTQPFDWPPFVFIFYYPLIIRVFPCYCLITCILLLFYRLCTLVPLVLFGPWQLLTNKLANIYKHAFQINGERD